VSCLANSTGRTQNITVDGVEADIRLLCVKTGVSKGGEHLENASLRGRMTKQSAVLHRCHRLPGQQGGNDNDDELYTPPFLIMIT
jgi:hypothetical protein